MWYSVIVCNLKNCSERTELMNRHAAHIIVKFGSLNSVYEVGYVTPHLLYVVLSMKATGKHMVGVCYCDMHADRTRLAHNVCTERRLTSHFCVVRELITTLLNWDNWHNSTVICPVQILITLLHDILPCCMWQVLSMTPACVYLGVYVCPQKWSME